MSKVKIVLFLLNKKGYVVLKRICKEEELKRQIDFVVLDQDSGNKEDFYLEMVDFCKNKNIKFYNRKDNYIINAEYSIAIGWRWFIKDVKNLIVIHDSLLPKYRGFSPLPNMLIKGEKEIGATAIFASKEMDKGEIIIQQKIKIKYPIKIKDAIDKMSEVYYSIVISLFKTINTDGKIRSFKQDENKASYSIWRDCDDFFINWNQSAKKIKRFIDSVGYPYEGAKTKIGGEVVNIDDVYIINDLKLETKHVGKILMFKEGKPVVICKNGAVVIESARIGNNLYKFNKLRQRLN